jgi:hypothetical protein
MIHAITIQPKEIVVDFNINDVKKAILKLPKMIENCTLLEQNDVFKKYDLQFTSFLSLGNKLSLTLVEIGETKTKITTDTTRMMGTFDEANEVTAANNDYTTMINALSRLLENPEMDEEEMKSHSKSTSNKTLTIVMWVILIIGLLAIFSR